MNTGLRATLKKKKKSDEAPPERLPSPDPDPPGDEGD